MDQIKRETFQSPYDQYKHHVGKKFKIIEVLPHVEDDGGNLYYIQFEDSHGENEEFIEAWPEEVFTGTGWEPADYTPTKLKP